MHSCCSGFGMKRLNEKFNISIEQIEKGVQITMTPKDESKAESFKKFVEACRDFCDDDCC